MKLKRVVENGKSYIAFIKHTEDFNKVEATRVTKEGLITETVSKTSLVDIIETTFKALPLDATIINNKECILLEIKEDSRKVVTSDLEEHIIPVDSMYSSRRFV